MAVFKQEQIMRSACRLYYFNGVEDLRHSSNPYKYNCNYMSILY